MRKWTGKWDAAQATTLATEESTADEGMTAAVGNDLEDFMLGTAESDQNWATNAGGPLEQFQQALGDDEVTAVGSVSQAEAGYAEGQAQNQETDAQNLDAQSPRGQNTFNALCAHADEQWLQDVAPTFENDSKQVAQDDANYQDALVDDAVSEAQGEASAEVNYASAEGPAVATELETVDMAQDQYAERLTANLGLDAKNTSQGDATQDTSLATVQAAYTTAAAQADADHQTWLAQNVATAPPPPDPSIVESADAQLALSKGEADANLAWSKSKDLADQKFPTADAEDWAATVDDEGKAQFDYALADDPATASDELAVAVAQAGQTTSDTGADATRGESDAGATGGFEQAEASDDATVMAWLSQQPGLEVPAPNSGTLTPSPWMAFEAELAQVRPQYEAGAVSDEEQAAQTEGDDEKTYATTDTNAFLSEVATLLGDDLSAAVGGTSGTSASDALASDAWSLARRQGMATAAQPSASFLLPRRPLLDGRPYAVRAARRTTCVA
ncbi:MAG TPA: hypothetical protein VNH11_19700 [Pirellulales bacterium]|nr:hypothetical protein [Pirellulales bacterium]